MVIDDTNSEFQCLAKKESERFSASTDIQDNQSPEESSNVPNIEDLPRAHNFINSSTSDASG